MQRKEGGREWFIVMFVDWTWGVHQPRFRIVAEQSIPGTAWRQRSVPQISLLSLVVGLDWLDQRWLGLGLRRRWGRAQSVLQSLGRLRTLRQVVYQFLANGRSARREEFPGCRSRGWGTPGRLEREGAPGVGGTARRGGGCMVAASSGVRPRPTGPVTALDPVDWPRETPPGDADLPPPRVVPKRRLPPVPPPALPGGPSSGHRGEGGRHTGGAGGGF